MARIKRLQPAGDTVWLLPENPAYQRSEVKRKRLEVLGLARVMARPLTKE